MRAARTIAHSSPAILILIVACGSDPAPAPGAAEGARLCVAHAQCAAGERCIGGVCEAPGPEVVGADAGVRRDPPDAAAGGSDALIFAFDARPSDPRDATASSLDASTPPGIDASVPASNLDLTGYALSNVEGGASGQTATIPAGSVLEPGQSIVIARDATRAEFEQAWGRSLGRALFVSTGAQTRGVPIINGDERWSIADPGGNALDGPTIPGVAGHCFSRSASDQWEELTEDDATPGDFTAPTAMGLVISEWCDRSGTGQYRFEFVELTWSP